MISKINEFYLNIFGIYILKKYIYLIIVGIATQLRSNLGSWNCQSVIVIVVLRWRCSISRFLIHYCVDGHAPFDIFERY